MSEPVDVAAADQIPPGQARVFTIGVREIVLYNVDGTLYASENTCCHRGGPLGEGELDGTTIRCPWHLWEFDVTTGACLNAPGMCVRTYPVRLQDGRVLVAL